MTFPAHIVAGVAFTPANIAGLGLWYDFSDAGNTIVSGAFSAVLDKSGSGHGLSQATAGKRPTVVTQNGLNAARFTAASSQIMDMATGRTTQAAYAVFMVCRRGGPSGSNVVQAAGYSGGSQDLVNWYSSGSIYSSGAGGYASAAGRSETGYHTIIVNYTGANTTKLYFDGADVTTSWAGTAIVNSCNAFGYGPSAYCNGEIAEFGLYAGVALTTQNRADLLAYLQAKWATP
jgi:hypothetical protein